MNLSLVKSVSVFIFLGLFLFINGMAQEYYWNFEGADSWVDKKKKTKMKVDRGRASIEKEPSGRSYLNVSCDQNSFIELCEITPQKQFSMEFLLRFDPKQCDFNPQIFYGSVAALVFRLTPDRIGFYNRLKTNKGVRSIYTSGKLLTTGRKSISYYMDEKWHHIALVFDGVSGEGSLFVDGEKVGKQQESLKGYVMGQKPFKLNIGREFAGKLDEIAIYFKALTPTEITQHAAAALSGQPYSAQVRVRNIPPKVAGNAIVIDPLEFAPDHPKVNLDPYKQLDNFPYPRYQAGHKLLPLFNWMGNPHYGGLTQEGISLNQAAKNAADINELLADKFHYCLVIPNSKEISLVQPFEKQYPVVQEMVKLANRRKDLPLGMITIWPQTKLTVLKGEDVATPYILRKNLPDRYYTKNTKGQYLRADGKVNNDIRWFSPTASADLFAKDGQAQQLYLKKWLSYLKRPLNFINENGETPPHAWRIKLMEEDRRIKQDFLKSGTEDWEVYVAQQKLRFRKTYSDTFLKEVPGLKNTIFSWYAIDGGPLDRFKWSESRYIHTPINGQYYSTPDFYPRNPDNWRNWKGPWRGWEWLVISRKVEIQAGDRLFSPFIGAGWSSNAERNVRPSHWLGLLKLLGPIGAEFYYTGFFNESPANVSGKPRFADPKNYIWQAAIPAYAQALTSYYEDVLREGDLLLDKKGQPIINTPVNDPRFLVSVRKAKNEQRYIIAGGIFPQSNQKGQVPDEGEVWVPIGDKKYRMCFRRQGSVYELDLSAVAPKIRQLDSWHELGHPSYWSQDLTFEGEMSESQQGVSHQTDWNSQVQNLELTDFVSYARADKNGAKLNYSFIPHNSSSKIELDIKARLSSAKKGTIKVSINGKTLQEIKLKSANWKTYSVKLSQPVVKGQSYELKLEMQKAGTDIDSFTLHQP